MSITYSGLWSILFSVTLVLFFGLKLLEMSKTEFKGHQTLYIFAFVCILLAAIVQIYKSV